MAASDPVVYDPIDGSVDHILDVCIRLLAGFVFHQSSGSRFIMDQ